jgi:glycosyltransferase involved in cell wall biosynthesis
VCFQDSGGAPEFVEQDAGICVPYGNVAMMAEALLDLIGDESKRSSMGICAQRKVINNYTLDTQAPKILTILKEFI